jgi:hypothetical protein
MVTRFQSMLTHLGFDALSVYYSKVVYHADGRCEWCTTVHIFDGELLYRKISGTSCHSTHEEAEANATWRAISTHNHLFEVQLQNTPFRYYLCCTLGTEKMTVAAIEVFMSPIARNRTKDALLDLSLNHERLLEENQRVCILLSKSEALIRAYQWRDAAGTSELYTSGARTWSATSSHRRGSVNQQLIEGDDADSQAYALALVSASSSR